MRPSNKSRSRNKTGNNSGHNNNQRRNNMGNIINRVFESAGPDGKVRGTPQQIIDKYQALARDAQVSGDRVAAESYLQHSEHYTRLLGEAQRIQQEARANQERENERNDDGGGNFDQQRRQPQQQPVASGLTTIDTDDGLDSGPIETPEGRRGELDNSGNFSRRERDQDRRPNGADHLAVQADAPRPEAQPAPETAQAPARPAEAGPEAAQGPARPRRKQSAAPEKAKTEPANSETAETAAEPEFQLAEPQAEPVKKPRTRRRKTQPAPTAGEEAAPAAAPEAAPKPEAEAAQEA